MIIRTDYSGAASLVKLPNFTLLPVAFASLPATRGIGTLAYITDSTTTTWGATITGGGTSKVLGWWNGAHWTVCGI